MLITLENTGRRYNSDWIFRKLSRTFEPGSRTAIVGHNGSGKSTLLKVIAGALAPSEGKIIYSDQYNTTIPRDKVYSNISFASPYLDLPFEFTGEELFTLHSNFRPVITNPKEALRIAGLEMAAGKKISSYSSGMRQRLRLAMAFLTKSSALFIDEPHTNLDRRSMDWYKEMVNTYGKDRTIFVCSNHQAEEYDFCSSVIDITEHKPQRKERTSLKQRI